MRGRAYAKVNLSLRVRAPRSDGLHPIVSLAQSIDWSDQLSVEAVEEDRFTVRGGGLRPDLDNLAWRAVVAMRAGEHPAVDVELDKSIAVAAGLGGGSADAALGLALGVAIFGRTVEAAVEAAPLLGADVPFCLAGGTARVEGAGERVTSLRTPGDYVLGIVVPPLELPTAAVYRRWDELDGPEGPSLDGRDLPVSLREHAPLGNDLQPAAVALSSDLGDWIADVRDRWGQPVAMSGSGPALFSFFPSESEADDAVAAIDGFRSGRAARPIDQGWEVDPGGTLPPPPWGVV